jgi:hypothetical protein
MAQIEKRGQSPFFAKNGDSPLFCKKMAAVPILRAEPFHARERVQEGGGAKPTEINLARPARLELATSWFVARRSIQLS